MSDHTIQIRLPSTVVKVCRRLISIELKATQGGLLAFNNFLSTSYNREISLNFAGKAIAIPDSMGVLFVMTIDPSLATTPFANIKDVSCYKREEEILLSMHAVFRVGQVTADREERTPLWQVDLTLTGDNDPQLRRLTEHMREETSSGDERLVSTRSVADLQMGQLNKAEELYEILLQQAID